MRRTALVAATLGLVARRVAADIPPQPPTPKPTTIPILVVVGIVLAGLVIALLFRRRPPERA